MFFFKRDPLKSLRENAETLLHHADKVWNYRRDVLSKDEADYLLKSRAMVAALTADSRRADFAEQDGEKKLSDAADELHETLCVTGGTIYPVRAMPEWVEMIVVATIVVCAIRSFFLQPFKIPTNSMYPTYHGMTAEVFPLKEDGVGGLNKIWRKLTLWTTRVEARAPVSGEVFIPLDPNSGPERDHGNQFDSGIFNTNLLRNPVDVFYLSIEKKAPVKITVPKEFTITGVLLKTYFPDDAKLPIGEVACWRRVVERASRNGDLMPREKGGYFLRTHKQVAANERVVNFDVLTGDMVLVDRMSYNFVRPGAGDPFVFATKNIPGLNDHADNPQDIYFIKRLVGEPLDVLQVKGSVLLRNGAPISGSPAFEKNNAMRSDLEYYGYLSRSAGNNVHGCPLDKPLGIPPAHYFAMGDNSENSFDSRGWGFVPEKEIIGRAFFILYPFRKRWGIAE
ncbi:MAG: signal peptidase I [Puniceicoccales bacterium]|nr:signal peptidase I [Puniceicoccales bacterium]